MDKRGTLVVVGVLGLLFSGAAAAAEKSAEELEQRYDAEQNPRRRAEVAQELLELRWEAIRDFVKTGAMLEESNPRLASYVGALERLSGAVEQAAHPPTSKKTEVLLRRHLKQFEELRISVSAAERPLLSRVIDRLSAAREEVLYGLMKKK